MTARWITADVFDGLATLDDGSVDLCVTSPPFLALRSYLPSDHPDKDKEIGSEATPAEFLDVMLAVTAELRRVLAPHGSIAVELGDTYAGSGGAGGDYEEDGLREGQPKFKQSRSGWHRSGQAEGERRGQRYRQDGYVAESDSPNGGPGWPLAKSRTLIPELYRIALAYGINPLTGQPSPAGRWRVRNVVTWCRPNPPVGALGDKWRPATSDVVVACVSDKRYWDDIATRHEVAPKTLTVKNGRTTARGGMLDNSVTPGDIPHTGAHPAGAPLLDYWEIPPGGYPGAHYAVYPSALVEPLIKAMAPPKVCRTCGEPQRRISEHLGRERWADPLTPTEFGQALTNALKKRGITHHDLASMLMVDEALIRHYLGKTGKRNHRLPSLRQWQAMSSVLVFDPETIAAMETLPPEYETPDRGNREIPERLSGGPLNGDRPKVVPTGWSDCSHDDWRPALILDCFAGSGTTLSVATGHGHDALGIDLDSRNADLARDRIGPFLFDETPAVPPKEKT